IIERIAVVPSAIDAIFVVEDRVKPDVAAFGGRLDGLQVPTPALPQREIGTARPEHLLPEMGKWPRGGIGIYADGQLRRRGRGGDARGSSPSGKLLISH